MPATFAANTDRYVPSKCVSAPHRKNAAQSRRENYQRLDRSAERNNPVQQLINQAIDSLIQQLKAGKSDALTTYLAAMARFHRYSFGNIMAIARRCPTATRVAGYQTWKELGRHVKKGEKEIQMFAPMVIKGRRHDTDELKSEENPHSVIIGFRPVYVWERARPMEMMSQNSAIVFRARLAPSGIALLTSSCSRILVSNTTKRSLLHWAFPTADGSLSSPASLRQRNLRH